MKSISSAPRFLFYLLVCHGERLAGQPRDPRSRYRRQYKSQILESVGAQKATLRFGVSRRRGAAAAWAESAKIWGCSPLVCRFVAVDLKMLDRQRPVMGGHLLVVLF